MLLRSMPFLGQRDCGFSLVEALIATMILATGLSALAQLFSVAKASNKASRDLTMATVLAAQKFEQLRALTWAFDAEGAPMSDTTTDTSAPSETSVGGMGLRPSPRGVLDTNTPGYVDFVDGLGTPLGGGTDAPAGAVYLRRWSVEPFAGSPGQTVIIQVIVARIRESGADSTRQEVGAPEAIRIAGVKTRKAP